ncbi:MAG: hypothetical protein ACRD9S_20065, partial [Pyrinomonadaceae bacterium]
MNTSKRVMIIAAFILIACLAASADAQRKTALQVNNIAPPQPIGESVTMTLNAIEVSDGVVGLDGRDGGGAGVYPNPGETIFGYGFLGRTTGDLPGSFMFSMNCTPAVFTPGESNEITGGMWTLPVYAQALKGLNTVYMGSLYGKSVSGKMGWDKDGNAAVYVNLTIEGGTQNWAGVTG